MYWDDKDIENGLPEFFDDEKFRQNKLNSSFIYLAMNLRKDDEDLKNLYKSFKNDASRDIFSKSSLKPWWIFHNLSKDSFLSDDFLNFKLNKVFSKSKLEGSYTTEFLKSSFFSNTYDGFVSRDYKKIKGLFKSLSKKDLDTYLKFQLKALDREVELLEIEKPKFLLEESSYDLVSYAFLNLLDKKEFPHLIRGEIVDICKDFKEDMTRYDIDLINLFLKNVDPSSYPKFMVKKLCENSGLIRRIFSIENKAHVMAIFYLSLDLTFNLSNLSFAYLEDIKKLYKKEIDLVRKNFSKDIIKEIIKNFAHIINYEKEKKKDFEFFKDKLESYPNTLVFLSKDMKSLLDILSFDGMASMSFLTSDIDQFMLINLMKKALGLTGFVFDKKASLKDLNYNKFISLSRDFDRILRIMKENNFIDSCIYLSFEDFVRKDMDKFRKSLKKDFKLYMLVNLANKRIYLKMGGLGQDKLSYFYYNKNFALFKKSYLDFEQIYEDPKEYLAINKLHYHKLYEFIKESRRGYAVNDILNSGLAYANDGIAYISNANISKGFVKEDGVKFSGDAKNFVFAKKGDLVISKNPSYKIAIIENDRNYLVNDNLFILKIDKSKVDPYYVLAFLNSNKARDIVSRKLGSSNKLTISLIKDLDIDFYPRPKRKAIACDFKKKLSLKKECYKKLEKTNKDLYRYF